MRKFSLINEQIDLDKEAFNSKYPDLTEAIKKSIEQTIENDDIDFDAYVKKVLKNPEEMLIDGLVNDADVIEFYQKFRVYVDEILNDIKFFDIVPTELNSYSFYSYLAIGTKRAIQEVLKNI